MLTYKIHLLRHGLTQANLEGRYIGRTDAALCEEGIEQLERLREFSEYPWVDRVYSSPLRRAMDSARILFPDCEPEPVDKLRELDFGAFENRTIEDLEQDAAFIKWIGSSAAAKTPGGESGEMMLRRVIEALAAIFAHMMEEQIMSCAVMTHAGIISALLAAIGLPERPAVRWQCAPGEGFTLLLTPQMWMRDQKVEVYAKIPVPYDLSDQ